MSFLVLENFDLVVTTTNGCDQIKIKCDHDHQLRPIKRPKFQFATLTKSSKTLIKDKVPFEPMNILCAGGERIFVELLSHTQQSCSLFSS